MVAELGLLFLLSTLIFSLFLGVIPLVGIYSQRIQWIQQTIPLVCGVFISVLITVILLGYALATNDFSILYVAQHSHHQLPLFYKIAALWGGHEGSMLFWLFCLALWIAIIAIFDHRIDFIFKVQVLAILGLISAVFCLFVLIFSNPFERIFPVVLIGRDLNPMLQDFGLIIHPPLLYIGYVGFAVNFAFAIGALLNHGMDTAIARWNRQYALTSWAFLTVGICLGSWWAYYELGWGGWWFWDPVENISLIPWLSGIALIHMLLATEKRGIYGGWSLLLAIFTFSFCLLGIFVVRSGILISVHAFASDPERGMVLLLAFGIAVLIALILFALRFDYRPIWVKFHFLSKEAMLLLANMLIMTALFSILLGTFYPLVFRLLNWQTISIGAPYFNTTFAIPVFIALLIMGIAAFSRWKLSPMVNKKQIILSVIATITGGVLVPLLLGTWYWVVAISVGLSIWVLSTNICALRKWSWYQFGLFLVHGGVAVVVIGCVISSYYTQEISVKMAPGSQVELGGYQFVFQQTDFIIGPNYTSEQAVIKVKQVDKQEGTLLPERRHYGVRMITMSEPGVLSGLFTDLYAVLGEKIDDVAYAVRIYYKPLVRWIWLGALLIVFGVVLIVCSINNSRQVIRTNEFFCKRT